MLEVAGGRWQVAAEVSKARRIYLDLQDGWTVQVQKRGKRKGEVKDVEKKGTALSTRSLLSAECRVEASTSFDIEFACC